MGYTKTKWPETLKESKEDPLKVKARYRFEREATKVSKEAVDIELKESKSYIRSLHKELDYFKSLDRFLENVNTSVEPFSPKLNVSRFKDGNKTAVFFLNDIHSGAKFANGNLSLDRKEYNFKVAQERMKLYCGYLETCLHTSFYSHGVSNIVFSALGDNLEAILANMRNGQFLTMDLFGHEQVEALVGLIVMALVTLVNNSKVPIHVVFTPGNHDRAVRDKSYESENILIAWIAQAVYFRTKELTGEGFERVTIDIAAPTANILLPNGVELILKHGHRGGSNSLSDAFLAKIRTSHGRRDSIRTVYVQGHYHTFKSAYCNGTNGYISPSFCGNTGYNLDDLNLSAQPMFFGLIIDKYSDTLMGPWAYYG